MSNNTITGLISNFKADTYLKAFSLASLSFALTTIGVLYIHDYLYFTYDKDIKKGDLLISIILVF